MLLGDVWQAGAMRPHGREGALPALPTFLALIGHDSVDGLTDHLGH